ncbi:MAG: type II toxin-antitoxin system RelE/ParE family toxin [Gemmatimonadaceae bacterium]
MQRRPSRVIDDIEGACRLLADHPGVGRDHPETAAGVTSFPVGSYVIFYTPLADGVGIARVLHGHRDLPPAFHQQ